jgi:hypothetical protein
MKQRRNAGRIYLSLTVISMIWGGRWLAHERWKLIVAQSVPVGDYIPAI